MKTTVCLLAAWLCACGESAQQRAEVPLLLAGTEAASFETNLAVPVTLTRAELAFGPLYLCSGAQAGELCETARLEWRDSAVVDCLDSRSTEVGALVGVTGPVRSFMYDLGFSSVLTRDEPLELDAARELGGVSLRVEGRFTRNGEEHEFRAGVAVRQGAEVERGIPVVRKSLDDEFEHDVNGDESALLVRFDARPWVTAVDFEALFAELCPDPSDGCPDPLVLDETTESYRAFAFAVGAGERPEFDWELER
jgi:hypothetical protein